MFRPRDERPTDTARQARIANTRRRIEAGTYETPDKLEAAVEAFLDSPEGDGSLRSPAPNEPGR